MELVPLQKRLQRAPSRFPPCGDTARRWSSMHLEAGSHQTPDLPASSSTNCEKPMLFKSPRPWLSVMAAPMD